MSERRRHTRAEVRASIDYSGSRDISCASIADISVGGVRLLLDGPEQPGTLVQVTVRFSSDLDSAAFQSEGLVVWARQTAPYLAGIRWVRRDNARNDLIERGLQLGPHVAN